MKVAGRTLIRVDPDDGWLEICFEVITLMVFALLGLLLISLFLFLAGFGLYSMIELVS